MSDPRCAVCLELFRSEVSCTPETGALHFGDEPDLGPAELLEDPTVDLRDIVCRDCWAPWGGVHHDGCTVAVCRYCHSQWFGHTRMDCWRGRRANRRWDRAHR